MSTPTFREIFVNLPVRDLKRSMAFFSGLGFEFNPKFSDDKGACMIVGADAYVMLLTQPFFQTFTDRKICDTSTHTEALLAVSSASREGVDRMVETAVAAGGAHAKDRVEHGDFMYGWSFYDLDGHHWEVLWMNPSAVE